MGSNDPDELPPVPVSHQSGSSNRSWHAWVDKVHQKDKPHWPHQMPGDAGLSELAPDGALASDAGMPPAPQPDAGMPPAPQPDAGLPPAPQPDAGLPAPDVTPPPAQQPDAAPAAPQPDAAAAAPQPDGAAAPPQPDAAAAPPQPDAKVPPAQPDAAVPPPPVSPPPAGGTLPTFVNLDWNKFPTDPGPNYGTSGSTWVVSQASGSDSNAGTAQSPFATINRAVTAAKAGDLIVVHSGLYKEGVSGGYRGLLLNKPLTLTAAAGESVTVQPKDSGYHYGVAIESSDVVVNGINLQGFEYSMQVGSSSSTQTNVVISNLTIIAPSSGFNEGIIAYADTRSKGFPTSDGLLIKNVTLKGLSMGVSCNAGPCHSWRLENVTVEGAGGTSWGADAIAIESGDNLLFHHVEVSGAGGDGIDTKATRVVVYDCNVHDIAKNGVKLWYGGDVVNTLIHHTGEAGIVTEQGPRVRLLHSVVAYYNWNGPSGYCLSFGYDSQAAQLVEIINSIIYRHSGGMYFNTKSTVAIDNSLFHDINNGMVLTQGGTEVYLSDGASALTTKGFGSNNLFADPLLSSTFHLTASSPGVDAGKTLPIAYPLVDALDLPRVTGAAPDLGPFEDF